MIPMSMQSVSLVACSLGGVVFMSLLMFQILKQVAQSFLQKLECKV